MRSHVLCFDVMSQSHLAVDYHLCFVFGTCSYEIEWTIADVTFVQANMLLLRKFEEVMVG